MLVFKFGGTSVGSAERIQAVAEIVEAARARGVVVVLSAMSGVTNALIAGARSAAEGDERQSLAIQADLLARHLGVVEELLAAGAERDALREEIVARLDGYERLCRSIATLGELTLRGNDAVASLGEELSTRILAALLRARGTDARAVSATACVRTDSQHGAARPDMAETRRLVNRHVRPLVEGGVVPVVTGYIGADARGVVTTLGRGGSDYSAAILGTALDAEEVWIWTDVNGILTADPRLVPEARTLTVLSYHEAEELAYFGASVLHPKTVAPLAAQGIPLRIANSLCPEQPGTLILPEPDPERERRPAIISTQGLCLVGVVGQGDGWSLLLASRALRALAEAGLDVLMFSQSFSERSLNVVLHREEREHAIHVLEREFANERALGIVARIEAQAEVATVSVVGMPNGNSAPTARAYAALGALGVRVVSIGQAASEYSVSLVIPEGEVARAVPFLHRELGL
ncbi:MAG: aspartate kinase [Chloroflexi bacterium]|nr:aspartate kinase [Chloroflexota bacterium]